MSWYIHFFLPKIRQQKFKYVCDTEITVWIDKFGTPYLPRAYCKKIFPLNALWIISLSPQFLCVLCVLLLLQAIGLTTALIFENKVNATFSHILYILFSHQPQRSRLPLTVCVSAPLHFLQTLALFQNSIREGIKHYYDDLDFKNILDYMQQKVVWYFI